MFNTVLGEFYTIDNLRSTREYKFSLDGTPNTNVFCRAQITNKYPRTV